MSAPVVFALSAFSFGVGSRAKKKAAAEERKRQIRAAWQDYGATAFEFDRSREQQRQFHADTVTKARAKLGASGVRPGTAQYFRVMGMHKREHEKEMQAIQARENEWRKTSQYQLAASVYESQTSVGDISKLYGLRGRLDTGGGPRRRDTTDDFSYDKYQYDNPLIPGYQGRMVRKGRGTKPIFEGPETGPTLVTHHVPQRRGGGPQGKHLQPGGERQALYVSKGFYDAARPTMDEFYWINYSGDETKATEAKAEIQRRADEYIATYGSIIALGPQENMKDRRDRRTVIKGPSVVPLET